MIEAIRFARQSSQRRGEVNNIISPIQFRIQEILLIMGCMADKEMSESSNLNLSAFSKQAVEKKETTGTILQAISENYNPQKIKLPSCSSLSRPQSSQPSIDFQSICQELVEKYNQCSNFYSSHEIDMAFTHCLVLSVKLKELKKDMQKNGGSIPLAEKDIWEMQKLIEKVSKEYSDVQCYEKQISRGGWIEKSNRKGIQISTRRESSTVGVLVNSIIDVPFEIIVSILIEMDLYKLFIPFMQVSKQQKVIARNCRIGYSLSKVPFLTKRQAFYQGIGYDRLRKKQALFLFTRSIHNRPDLQNDLDYTAEVNKSYVQLEYKYFVLKYRPITRVRGQITLAMNVDTKVDFVPVWLQDKISQDYGQNFLLNLINLSKNFKNSIWEEKVKANPSLHDFFKNRIEEHLNEKQDEYDLGNL